MNGRRRVEQAAKANGYTDETEPDQGRFPSDRVRRYSSGSRRITVEYNLTGMVMSAWTTDRRLGPGAARKAECVIDYLEGADPWPLPWVRA